MHAHGGSPAEPRRGGVEGRGRGREGLGLVVVLQVVLLLRQLGQGARAAVARQPLHRATTHHETRVSINQTLRR